MLKLFKTIIWLLTLLILSIQPIILAASAKAKKTDEQFIQSVEAWLEDGLIRVQAELNEEYQRIEIGVSSGGRTESATFEDTDKIAMHVNSANLANQLLIQFKALEKNEVVNSALVRVNSLEENEEESSLQLEKADWEKKPEKTETIPAKVLVSESIVPQAAIKKWAIQYEKGLKKNKSEIDTRTDTSSYQDQFEMEPNNTRQKADWITANYNGYGRISKKDDIDYWKVKLSDDGKFNVWLGELPANKNYDIYVYDSEGKELKRSEKPGSMDEWIEGLSGEKNQFFYILIKSKDGSFDKNKYYHLKVISSTEGMDKADEYEPNNNFNQAAALQLNQTILANNHNVKDFDFYKIRVDMPSTIYLKLSNISEEMDLDLFLYDSTKKQVERSENTENKNESITYSGNPGDYYIKVALAPKSKLSAKPYKLLAKANTMPVILIPGIGGTQLALDSGKVTWIDVWDIIVNSPIEYNLSLEPVSPGSSKVKSKNGVNIVPIDEEYGLSGISRLTRVNLEMGQQFRDMISDLCNTGYKKGTTLFGFPYDWRMDVRDQHSKLQEKIKEALIESGAQKVQIVAHSLGGLLVKDYLLVDKKREEQIEKLITIGTPFWGAGKASIALTKGYNFDIPLLLPQTGYEIAKNSPSVYLLTPSEEYDKKMQETLKRGVYGYYDKQSKFISMPYSKLIELYPNQALASMAKSRKSSWNNRYPSVKQYHIIGDTVMTTTGFNKREFFISNNPILRDEFIQLVLTPGDGTVPLISGQQPGSPRAKIFYAKTEGHLELLKEDPIRQQVIRLLNGNESIVSGIQTTPHKVKQKSLTSYSLTSKKENFKGLQLLLLDEAKEEYEKVEFTPEGNLDRIHSTKAYIIEDIPGSDHSYNVQVFVDSESEILMSIESDKLNKFFVSSYDTGSDGTKNPLVFENPKKTATHKISIQHSKKQRKAKADGKELKASSIHFD